MYAYQSSMLCDDCAYNVIDQLEEKGIADDGTTENYPQSAMGTESDSPEHCGDCGEFLENDLTSTGLEYVADAIMRHCKDGDGNEHVIKEWADYYPGHGLKWESVPLMVALKIASLLSTEIKAVRYQTNYGEVRDLPFYEEWDLGAGKPYLFADETGLLKLVVARNECDAHSIFIDECETVETEEVHEAYGAFDKLLDHMKTLGHTEDYHLRRFCSEHARSYFEMWRDGYESVEAELVEGYEYQSNASGTGIVSVSHSLRFTDPTGYGIVVDLVSE